MPRCRKRAQHSIATCERLLFSLSVRCRPPVAVRIAGSPPLKPQASLLKWLPFRETRSGVHGTF